MYKFSQIIVLLLTITIFASQSISAVTMPCEANTTNNQHSSNAHSSMHGSPHNSMHSSMHDNKQMSHHLNAEMTKAEQVSDNCCDTQCSCPQTNCSSVYVSDNNTKSNLHIIGVQKIHRLISNYQINTQKSLYRPPIFA